MHHFAEKGIDAEVLFPDAEWKRRFRRRIRSWFSRHARDLPWRRTRDAYAIWVSEIMLQQTQVVTVVPYYLRFLQAFPAVEDLARSGEEQVLRLWEGLGYYRRARQLHRAAQVIMAEHDGRFPRDIQAIRSLPGIGRYTAAAIASIAWDARQPILEANTTRVFSRLLAFDRDLSQTSAQQVLWRFSECLLPKRNVGLFNQALMELGSEVCTPRGPNCDRCPAKTLCVTRQRGRQDEIPRPKKKAVYEDVLEAAIVVRRKGAILLRRCGPGERWAGLWDFPRFPIAPRNGANPKRLLEQRTSEMTGVTVSMGRRLTEIKHGVTRYRITLHCHEARYTSGRLRDRSLRWVAPENLGQYPLSVTGRKISTLLQRDAGN